MAAGKVCDQKYRTTYIYHTTSSRGQRSEQEQSPQRGGSGLYVGGLTDKLMFLLLQQDVF